MPYKDPVIAKQKAGERGKRRQEKKRKERLAAGLPEDGRGKHGNHVKASDHYRWNSGRLTNRQGYALVRVGKSHPLADPNGYALEHMLVVMAAHSPGAALLQKYPTLYIVHHKNEDKLDNRIENLSVLTREEHNKIHNLCKERDEKGRFQESCTEANPCCERRGEYSGFGSGPLLFQCPKDCTCHD